MDDFPASPACPDARGPSLSVVIPVRDGGQGFERCLRALRDTDCGDYELIVVDDGSGDGSGDRAAAFDAKVVRHDRPQGPAAARNAGAHAATAPLIFFLDGDVMPHRDTLTRALAHFAREPGLAALFGSYDDDPEAPGLVSQYRNLLHHFVHQQGDFDRDIRPAHTFWTGCGVIRRGVFLALGGFDAHLYRRPAIEDIEFGYRLARVGYRVALARDVQVRHLKRWSLASTVRTDLLHRGIPWMVLMLRSRVSESDLNVSPAQRASVALTGLGLVAGVLALAWLPALGVAAMALTGLAWLNWSFYAFLARRRGRWFALRAFPLHLVYFLCCGLSVGAALAMMPWLGRGEPTATPGRVDPGRAGTLPTGRAHLNPRRDRRGSPRR